MDDYWIKNRDHKFIWKEWLDPTPVFTHERYKDWAVGDIESMLDLMRKVSKEVVAPSNRAGDSLPATFADGKVYVSPEVHKAYWFIQENGWGSNNEYKETEGALPFFMQTLVKEFFGAANPACNAYVGLTTGAANLIQTYGTEADKKRFCEKMFSGKWAGTMCLTEPGTGSDLGDQITKAYSTDDPRIYKIKGTKSFITGGDQDITENIVHLLIARVDGAAEGTKGLSLFIVPKIWVDEDGSLAKPNDVTTVGIEKHKLGIKASATAVLNFGEADACRAILLGNPPNDEGVGEGIAQMFQMMNHSRLNTGIQSMAIASSAYAYAVCYAKERIQGRPYTNPHKNRVPIIEHEDIRRLLLNSKAMLEGQRALISKTALSLDLTKTAPTPEERKAARKLADINTPLIKAFCSDTAWGICADAIQVLGGYGFSEEYPLAQAARDVKIYSIWEGTSFIQAVDLVGRKFSMDNGRAFSSWLADIKASIDQCAQCGEFDLEVGIMNGAWQCINDIRDWYALQGIEGGNRALQPLYATRTLHSCAMLVCAQLLLDQARIALKNAAEVDCNNEDYVFYKGKVDTARYYVHNIVPFIMTYSNVIMTGDTSAIDFAEDAF